jgi:hypothetical protein
MHKLLTSGHDGRMKEVLRMEKATFESLISWASRINLLKSSKNITAEEQLFIFLKLFGIKFFQIVQTKNGFNIAVKQLVGK